MEFGKEGGTDAGLGHAPLQSEQGVVVEARDLSRQQAHRVRPAQRCNSRGRELWIVEWTVNGLNLEIRHKPNAIQPLPLEQLRSDLLPARIEPSHRAPTAPPPSSEDEPMRPVADRSSGCEDGGRGPRPRLVGDGQVQSAGPE